MSHANPNRPLRSDFTEYTLRHAIVAQQRVDRKQHLMSIVKEVPNMKPLKHLRAMPGVALAVIIIAGGSVGAYAFSNWFGGSVTVKQTDLSVLTVDLSQCKGHLPPGIATTTDRRKVQFKVVGQPHISAADLQHDLLVGCEYNSVLAFYHSQPAMKDYPLSAYPNGTVKSIGDNSVTIEYLMGGNPVVKTFQLASGGTVYDQGQPAQLTDLHAGDSVIFAFTQQQAPPALEGTDPYASATQVQSLFKTQYNQSEGPGAGKDDLYDAGHIMPLDEYNHLPRVSPRP